MVITIDAEKTFWQNSILIYDKNVPEVGIEGPYLSLIKVIHDKPSDNVILNGEKLKAFPLRWGKT